MTKHKRHSYLVIQEQHILVVLLGSPLDGEKKAVTNGTAFLLVLSQSSRKSVAVPDYDKAYILAEWNSGNNDVTIPDDGWIYVWDGDRENVVRYDYPNVTRIILTSNRRMYSHFYPTLSNISPTTVATQYHGYASSIIPVYKGQIIHILSIEDNGCYVWFIPVR